MFDDNYYMKQALKEAHRAFDEDEVPIGRMKGLSMGTLMTVCPVSAGSKGGKSRIYPAAGRI